MPTRNTPEMPPEEITRRLSQTTPTETVEQLMQGMVWLGDLSGYELGATTDDGELLLTHRCGWELTITIGSDHYLANIVDAARDHRKAGCRDC